jgi:hypothetical protein
LDLNADRKKDVISFAWGKTYAWLQTKAGGFSSKPDLKQEMSGSRVRRTLLQVDRPPVFEDLNRDGAADVVFLNMKKARLEAYLSRDGEFDLQSPQVREVSESWGVLVKPLVLGNQRRALLMATLERFGIAGAIDLLARKSVTILLSFFSIDEKGQISAQSRQNLEVVLPFTARLTQRIQLVEAVRLLFSPEFGDFNGDGWTDLLVLSEGTELLWHPGTPAGTFRNRPEKMATLTLPEGTLSVHGTVADFNRDAKSDLVLHYRMEGEEDRVEVRVDR